MPSTFSPPFTGLNREHIFRDYLDDITDKHESLIYLLRGMRYDFSEPPDVQEYLELQNRLSNTSGEGVSAILINSRGQVFFSSETTIPR